MASFHTSVTYSAAVKFSPSKVCFICVPDSWLRDSVDFHVFKLFYGNLKEAYVSSLSYKSTGDGHEPYILINGKFAEMLEIKEKDKICLQAWFHSIPAVQDIRLEPLTPDDWEILELNAKYVEQDLMNQIRVVWINQVFPVWVNNSSLYVRVAQMHPNVQPALLVEFTAVHIMPMERRAPEENSPNTSTGKIKPTHHLQFQHLRNKPQDSPPLKAVDFKSPDVADSPCRNNENMSTVARAFSLFSSFLHSPPDEQKLDYSDNIYRDFVPLELDLTLQVLPYSRPLARSLQLVVQATTVFINASTYVALYGAEDIPPCFVAVLRKFPSPNTQTERKPHATNNSKTGSKGKEEINSSLDGVVEEYKQPAFDSVCVTVMVMRSSDEDEFNLPHSLFCRNNAIVVPKELKRSLSLEVSSLVHLTGVKRKPAVFNTIEIHPVSHLQSEIVNEITSTHFEKWALGAKREVSYVVSDGTLVCMNLFGQKHDFFISLRECPNQTSTSSSSSLSSISPNSFISEHMKHTKSEPRYGFLNCMKINDIHRTLGCPMIPSILLELPYLQKPGGLDQEIPFLHLDSLGGIKEVADIALECLEFWLKLRPIAYISYHPFTFTGCMLICGPKGVGKTAFAHGLYKKLSKSPHHVSFKVIPCLPLKGKRVEIIAKKWNDTVYEAVCCQPCVILLEDLDYIAGRPASHEKEVGSDGIFCLNIVRTFIHMLMKISESSSKIAVIVTSQSTHSLHSALIKTKGRHVFQKVIEIQPPNVEQRKDILCSLVESKPHISDKSLENISWKKIATRTEGYVAQDLDNLVDRATHAAWVRMANSSKAPDLVLNLEDFEMALEGFVPVSLRGIPLQVHDLKTWEDVGGLREVKKVIQQIIMWPIKYKQIFKSYSLKLQTNILLYGAPGTGKTLLAGAIANACGLNFISIKGPELLSKYIGASEQAVRDLFKRRGHDSTGVTDRVVNQLLTQLDGVESLEGVHVIAASSRPELIDPALLRPGRLDKCLLCPLPNEDERFEILNCLSSKLPVSDDIDLQYIASRTEHFSGADLQALLYTANIEAFHDVQNQSTRRYSTGSEDLNYSIASDKLLYMPTIEDGLNVPTCEEGKKIIQEVAVIKDNFCGIMESKRSRHRSSLNVSVNQSHLLKVVDDMKPSVSAQERRRYEAVFKKFRGVLSGEPAVPDNVKRVTLA